MTIFHYINVMMQNMLNYNDDDDDDDDNNNVSKFIEVLKLT